MKVIYNDYFDEQTYKEVIKNYPKISQIHSKSHYTEDLFNSLNKYEPIFDADAPESMKSLFNNIFSMQEYKDLRNYTRLDEVASSFGTVQIAPVFLDAIKKLEELEKQKSKVKGPDELESIDNEIKNTLANSRHQIRSSLKEAVDQAEDMQQSMQSFGYGKEDKELGNVTSQERFQFAKKLSDKLKKISELIGRLQSMMQGSLDVTFEHGYDEIIDISVGGDISKITPYELSKLDSNPTQFALDLLEGKLQQYTYKSIEEKAMGPIIICLDVSGSMQTAFCELTRDDWSKAIALAIGLLANKHNRSFGIILFNENIKYSVINPSKKEMLNLVSLNCDGGTNYDKPIQNVHKVIIDSGDFQKADVLFITDGECNISENSLKILKELKNKFSTCLYTMNINSHQSKASILMSDKVYNAVDLESSINSVQDLSQNIFKK